MKPTLPIILLTALATPFAQAEQDLDTALEKLEKQSAARPANEPTQGTAILSQRPGPPPSASSPENNPAAEPKPQPPAASPRSNAGSPLVAPPSPPPSKPFTPPTSFAPPPAEANAGTVWALDPRHSISVEQVAKEGYEVTNLSVQRVLIAAGLPADADENTKPAWSRRLPISIPIFFPSRTLRLTAAQAEKARAVLKGLESLKERSNQLKKESERLLSEWNAIVAAGTPTAALSADSPSLPTNQSNTAINRGEAKQGFAPGEDVSFSIR